MSVKSNEAPGHTSAIINDELAALVHNSLQNYNKTD
jgi:hypothetical protein